MIERRTIASDCAPLFPAQGHPEIRRFPWPLRKSCGDRYLGVDGVQGLELRLRLGLGSVPVRRGSQWMRRQGSYRLAQFFLPTLKAPPPGLEFLLETLRGLGDDAKLRVIFEGRVRRGSVAYYRERRHAGEVHLLDTLSDSKGGRTPDGLLDQSTLYHEVGHHLMRRLYGGKFPDYRGHPGHDFRVRSYAEARTHPGAAWAEGFAGAIANLDFRSRKGIHGPQDLAEDWPLRDRDTRLSNEFVIAAILTDYVKSELPQADGSLRIGLDEAAFARLRKIFAVMRASGLHQDFAAFLGDFQRRYPGEGPRLLPILRRYGMADFASRQAGG
ncbi:MAG: hypothetical protein U1F66_04885 [bacterium]